eukprot:357260-Chlamydomonas_euryale.AAC.3
MTQTHACAYAHACSAACMFSCLPHACAFTKPRLGRKIFSRRILRRTQSRTKPKQGHRSLLRPFYFRLHSTGFCNVPGASRLEAIGFLCRMLRMACRVPHGTQILARVGAVCTHAFTPAPTGCSEGVLFAALHITDVLGQTLPEYVHFSDEDSIIQHAVAEVLCTACGSSISAHGCGGSSSTLAVNTHCCTAVALYALQPAWETHQATR